ncbi:pyrroline-5-carboxylate reductase [Clostridium sp. JN-1]|uniref:pyrroline-5-carboxylate reductase n=1 Tax=Clostridium sp. JN-1 TaxID=2483110 RepID=UPI000F0B8FFE|nr:pyrroline-5-carboxylate reductase [Clostridium sp. JN-1]
MNKLIGFIGSGNMGQAIIGGIVKSGLVESKNIIVSDIDESKIQKVSDKYGVKVTVDSTKLVEKCDIIFLAVKPNVYDTVLNSIEKYVTPDKIIVSIAAGRSIESIEAILGCDKKIIRTMPNTPALVNEGMAGICRNKNVKDEELEFVKSIFESFGKAEIIPEYLIDSVVGISGSSPAYVFMFIEALADAGVMGGMPRDKAYKFAAQAVLGSAKMVLELNKHPGELKDMVCSPAGTTIDAVATLESLGFRSAVIKAAADCIKKSKEMGKK